MWNWKLALKSHSDVFSLDFSLNDLHMLTRKLNSVFVQLHSELTGYYFLFISANKIRIWKKGVDSESFHPRFRSSEMRWRLRFDS